ncbi:hypothetical protein A9264_10255 [Vibrio sp. UCD-FRSSP16_10]|uniref:DUF3549 family protein n=1 Tax=unclassified Vibrio TaxID=2614977 RepID=UPI000800F6B4|nr:MULTISPECIES: DUF3549 family protein [unclassified Vibrio]OBT16868.1 hypothetical protein A9260_10480 [Vibrio sp. UCD-FRSSP16_30]OBT21856.1 hypothetical protein A9264_10255 [Vibrio sp. UCD-FRSSP16_10]
MENISTLTQILNDSHCQFKVHDLGRRIELIPNDEFESIELGRQAYPYPIQRQAQFAITYWNEQKQPWIWFLKFDLDERGLLSATDIGNFIKFVLEAMGSRLQKELSEEIQEQLASNPYTFKPKEDKLAVFNSQVSAELELSASQYYAHALTYFNGNLGWSNWQTVGLQGITDICARLKESNNELMVKKSLSQLPTQPLYALLGALEHCDISTSLANRLYDLALEQLNHPEGDLFLLSALTRALSGDKGNKLESLVTAILSESKYCHQEVLIALAGRCWQPLQDSALAEQFLIRLAETNNQELFNQLFADLVMQPKLRMVILPMLHQAPSQKLASALINLQQNTKGQS